MSGSALHVMFIDDDELMLKAAGRMLRRLRPDWHFTLVNDPRCWQEAAAEVAQEPELIISDLLMPNLQGDELLKQASQAYPNSIRALITGDTSKEASALLNSSVHFMLPKPFSEEDFVHVLNSAERLKQMPFSTACRAKLAEIEDLPVLPRTILQIRQCILRPEASIQDVSDLVNREPTLAARLVQLANSAYLGFQVRTSSLSESIRRLGLAMVEAVASIMLTQKSFKHLDSLVHQQIVNRYLNAAEKSKVLSERLNLPSREQEKIYLMTLLCSIGELVLLEKGAEPDQFEAFYSFECGYKDSLVICSYILILWGYSVDMAESILRIGGEQTFSDEKIDSQVLLLAMRWMEAEASNSMEAFLRSLPDHYKNVIESILADAP